VNLAIDCGNTRLKWGVHDGTRWLAQGLLDYADLAGLADLLRAQPRAQRAIVCNVAGVQIGEAVRAALAALDLPVLVAKSQSLQHGVRNLYDVPEQLGADRWSALVGARALHAGAWWCAPARRRRSTCSTRRAISRAASSSPALP